MYQISLSRNEGTHDSPLYNYLSRARAIRFDDAIRIAIHMKNDSLPISSDAIFIAPLNMFDDEMDFILVYTGTGTEWEPAAWLKQGANINQ